MYSVIGSYVKHERRRLGLTQEEFAIRSGLGLRFVRDLEQGKKTVRLDKVNQALNMFGMEAVPGRIQKQEDSELEIWTDASCPSSADSTDLGPWSRR